MLILKFLFFLNHVGVLTILFRSARIFFLDIVEMGKSYLFDITLIDRLIDKYEGCKNK